VPLLYAPGSAHRYSGAGYYALAYTLASALHAHSGGDLRRMLTERFYAPLGIPIDAWGMSYGRAYEQDGLSLYAIGSGASFTPRALARVGQLVSDAGVFNGDTLVAPGLFPALHCSAMRGTEGMPVPCLGWWSNATNAWPSLPKDALVAYGVDDQVLLVVPGLDLVAVRLGDAFPGAISDSTESERRYLPMPDLDDFLFRPIRAALVTPERIGAPDGRLR